VIAADLARREKDLGIHIFHAIDPLPTELQEFCGAVVIDCKTVVVGRNAFPWLEGLLASHLGEEVEQKAEEICVSVID
jgi:hypothetical protein